MANIGFTRYDLWKTREPDDYSHPEGPCVYFKTAHGQPDLTATETECFYCDALIPVGSAQWAWAFEDPCREESTGVLCSEACARADSDNAQEAAFERHREPPYDTWEERYGER